MVEPARRDLEAAVRAQRFRRFDAGAVRSDALFGRVVEGLPGALAARQHALGLARPRAALAQGDLLLHSFARPLGVSVDVVPLGVGRGHDVSIQKLSLPGNLKKGQTFEVKIFAQADTAHAGGRTPHGTHLLL